MYAGTVNNQHLSFDPEICRRSKYELRFIKLALRNGLACASQTDVNNILTLKVELSLLTFFPSHFGFGCFPPTESLE